MFCVLRFCFDFGKGFLCFVLILGKGFFDGFLWCVLYFEFLSFKSAIYNLRVGHAK